VRKPYRRKGDDRLHLLVQTELILIIYCGYAFQVRAVAGFTDTGSNRHQQT
jgi:hypothetical protein